MAELSPRNWLPRMRRMLRREETVTVVIDISGCTNVRKVPDPYDVIVGVYRSDVTDEQVQEDVLEARRGIPGSRIGKSRK